MIYPTRRWALRSLNEWAGKTTFMAANMKTPALVVDADGRFDLVGGLYDGKATVLKGIDIMDALALQEAVQAVMMKRDTRHILVDPLTKLYTPLSRRASMAGRLKPAEREKRNYGKNVAALHVPKADMVETVANFAAYGVDFWVSWHQRSGVNSKGKKEVRERISEIEINTVRQSIDVELVFQRKTNPAWQSDKSAQTYLYGVLVESARGLAGRPANVGFTVWDTPGNYWRGGADRLERLIYTSFAGPEEAIAWGQERHPDTDMAKEYGDLKGRVSATSASLMFVAWVEHVDSLGKNDEDPAPTEGNKQAIPAPVPSVGPSATPELYGNGKQVETDDLANAAIYKRKFGRPAYEQVQLLKAAELNEAKGEWE